jgi:hypothetical protein
LPSMAGTKFSLRWISPPGTATAAAVALLPAATAAAVARFPALRWSASKPPIPA